MQNEIAILEQFKKETVIPALNQFLSQLATHACSAIDQKDPNSIKIYYSKYLLDHFQQVEIPSSESFVKTRSNASSIPHKDTKRPVIWQLKSGKTIRLPFITKEKMFDIKKWLMVHKSIDIEGLKRSKNFSDINALEHVFREVLEDGDIVWNAMNEEVKFQWKGTPIKKDINLPFFDQQEINLLAGIICKRFENDGETLSPNLNFFSELIPRYCLKYTKEDFIEIVKVQTNKQCS